MRRALWALWVAWALIPGVASAADTPEDRATQRELDRLRARVADQVQLSAYELLDELVYGWTQAPPFGAPTPVTLVSMTAPVGLGVGLSALMENHLAGLLLVNPSTHITLAHCPACAAMVAHAGPDGTIIARGADQPEALAKLGGPGGRHGLYVDVEAEGAWLVLRARVVQLTPDLPIVWSRTITRAASAPALLRHPQRLKSAQAARQDLLDAARGRGPFTVPLRFTLRSYEPGEYAQIAPPPILWIQTGLEIALTHNQAWTASALVGFAWLPEAYDGVMLQARMSRLISGEARALTHPDLYAFFGGALMRLDGPTIAPFATDDAQAILRQAEGSIDSLVTFGGFHGGLELRMGNRLGVSTFLEWMPAYQDSDKIGAYLGIFHSLGAEVTFCF